MATDRTDKSWLQHESHVKDDDRPPPIAPRPSFTFAAVSQSQNDADCTALQTSAVHTDSSSASSLKTATRERPVPPPRHKSKKSTNELNNSVDTGRDELMSPVVNDEVFLACNDVDNDAVLDDKTTVDQCLSTEDQKRSSNVSAEAESDGQTRHLSEKQLPSSASSMDAQTTENNLHDGGLADVEPLTTSRDCDRLVADDGNPSTETVSIESSVGAHVRRYDPAAASSSREQGETQSLNSRAPVISFSEIEDFGLDPDLFRPDCLDDDVLFSEKTAKFTRSASPLYEAVTDEDDTGNKVAHSLNVCRL